MSEYRIIHEDELYHYGVKGMRWGVRKNSKNKNIKDIMKNRHLGIDNKGNINFTNEKNY